MAKWADTQQIDGNCGGVLELNSGLVNVRSGTARK
jgi:hypothetical protein